MLLEARKESVQSNIVLSIDADDGHIEGVAVSLGGRVRRGGRPARGFRRGEKKPETLEFLFLFQLFLCHGVHPAAELAEIGLDCRKTFGDLSVVSTGKGTPR